MALEGRVRTPINKECSTVVKRGGALGGIGVRSSGRWGNQPPEGHVFLRPPPPLPQFMICS